MLPSKPQCAPKKQTKTPEKVGFGTLPKELRCGLTEIWTQHRPKPSKPIQNIIFSPWELWQAIWDHSIANQSSVQALEPLSPCSRSLFVCTTEKNLPLFWLLYTFYQPFVGSRLVKISWSMYTQTNNSLFRMLGKIHCEIYTIRAFQSGCDFILMSFALYL